MSYKFKFGDKVKETITEYEGTVVGLASYITGCDQILVQPPLIDNKWEEGRWLDDGRLKLVISKEEQLKEEDVKSETGNGACGIAPIK